MIQKNVSSIDCYEKNSYQNFWLASLAFYNVLVYNKICLDQKYLGNFTSSVLHIPHNSFPNQKSRWKIQVHVVTSQELKIVCGESNEKIVLCSTAEKKIVCF